MRNTFAKMLVNLARNDKRIMLLTGDLGYSVFESFMEQFPDQYINCGVAEQNMTGVAAGLATEGMIPFVYSIVPFVTMRNFEQIRNDVCSQHLQVVFVGVGAGFSYGALGYSHYGIEDVAVMRSLPGMSIFTPCDSYEVEKITTQLPSLSAPAYLRLGRSGEEMIHTKDTDFALGKGSIFMDGRDLTIVTMSTMASLSLAVARELSHHSLRARVVGIHAIKPFDKEIIIRSAKETKKIITIEEHSVIGGLGTVVAEVLAESSISVEFKRFGTQDAIVNRWGNQEYMRSVHGLSVDRIVHAILGDKDKT
jgi:transketolase